MRAPLPLRPRIPLGPAGPYVGATLHLPTPPLAATARLDAIRRAGFNALQITLPLPLTDLGLLETLLTEANQSGLQVLLSAQPAPAPRLLRTANGSTRSDWTHWWRSYQNALLQLAILAESHHVPVLCIGESLRAAELEIFHPTWELLLQRVRHVFSGRLTYAAPPEQLAELRLWEHLDLIGVHGRWEPVHHDTNPTEDALAQHWAGIERELRQISQRHRKPVLMLSLQQTLPTNRQSLEEAAFVDHWAPLLRGPHPSPWFHGVMLGPSASPPTRQRPLHAATAEALPPHTLLRLLDQLQPVDRPATSHTADGIFLPPPPPFPLTAP